jgi:DNA polymerase-3 subunit epsilon
MKTDDQIEICLDTETTGLSRSDDRICEIGCYELKNLIPTGNTFHAYINPKKPMPREAERVHGLSDAFLQDKPVFRQVAPLFLKFIAGKKLVIHNASFDLGMLNAELARLGRDPLDNEVEDTLQLSRKVRPGRKHTLDLICKEYGVDLSKRVQHGALLDAELLAGAYLGLRGGAQRGLELGDPEVKSAINESLPEERIRPKRIRRITRAEFERHKAFVRSMGETAIWLEHDIYAKHLKDDT